MKANTLFLLPAVILAGWSHAALSHDVNTSDILVDLAFTPEHFYVRSKRHQLPLLTIEYRGDDNDVPVFSIAIAQDCDGRTSSTNYCNERKYFARMVRAPRMSDDERPRASGYRLSEQIRLAKVRNKRQLIKFLNSGGVEWLETSVASCEGAYKSINALRSANWQSRESSKSWHEFSRPGEENPLSIIIHADTMKISYNSNYNSTTYDGIIEKWRVEPDDFDVELGNKSYHVSTMAMELYRVLERCWKPSTSTPPWRISNK